MRTVLLVLLGCGALHAAPTAAQDAPMEPDQDVLSHRIEEATAEVARNELADKAAAEQRMADQTRAAGRAFHDALKDGSAAPEMVILPAGSFEMGSPASEADRDADEGPQHHVTLKSFALGKYELTVAQFRRFAKASGYKTDAEKNSAVDGKAAEGCFSTKGGTEFGYVAGTSWKQPGFSQGDRSPAVCLSFNDVQAYAEWLSSKTGKRYRLPSEAEQEYAIRAGSPSRYPWGADADQACRYANFGDSSLNTLLPAITTVSCDDGAVFTVAIGRYSANAYGLYDTIGNVWEWAGDCYHESYAGAPSDGSSWNSGGCGKRVLRGAGWGDSPVGLRAAYRLGFAPANRSFGLGVRVAQDL